MQFPLSRSLGPFGAAAARASSLPFTPADVAFWYRPESLSLSDGDPLAVWPDSSGNGRHATPRDIGSEPTYHAAAVNGIAAVRFGSPVPTFAELFSAATPTVGTVFVVAGHDAATFGNFEGLLSPEDNIIFTGEHADSTWFTSSLDGTRRIGGVDEGLAIPALGQWNIYSYEPASPLAWSGICIGNDRTNYTLGRAWLGDIGEVLGFASVLASPGYASVLGYLAAKYGL